MNSINRRRNYFIDKRLQGIWALLNLVIAGIVGLLIGFEIIRSFYVEFGWPLANKPFHTADLIFIVKILVFTLVGGGFFWLLSAFAGHRIAGPIFKLDQSLKEVTKGNYTLRINFRKKDFFQDIAHTFNEMNQSLEQNFQATDKLLAKIKNKVDELPPDNTQVRELQEILGVKK